MEKRRYERYEINVEAILVYREMRFSSIIENFSDGGLGIRCNYSKDLNTLSIDDQIHIETEILYQEMVNFPCTVRWRMQYDDQKHGSIFRVGMEHLNVEDK